ncbi:MAG: ferric reductase-like transmembrane domain-containing protein [Acidimicrobiales bacterium]
MSIKLAWNVARAGGIVAWGLLGLSVIWGLLLSSRLLGRWAASARLLELHRWLGALAVIFTGVHLGGLVGDNWLYVGWGQILVPQASTWRPWAVTWGVVAFYLLLAVQLSSLCRRFLPTQLWRRVHYCAFPLVLFASLHGAQAGTDATQWIYQACSVGLLSLIIGLTLVRLAVGRRARRSRQPGRQLAGA